MKLSEKKHFTAEELAVYNGQSDKDVYISYKEKVFDVSGSRLWKNGVHMMSHHAGKDLTDEFKDAPHGSNVFDRYPQVGILEKEEIAVSEEYETPGILARTMSRYPLLKRHPHPFMVHFPIVLMVLSPLFTVLYLITGTRAFEVTSFHCLACGLLFTLAAIPSGLLTWWVNYSAHFFKPVIVKTILSPILFGVGFIVFIWRLKNTAILEQVAGPDFLYLILLFLLAPLVLIIGWFGASMTFPLHKD